MTTATAPNPSPSGLDDGTTHIFCCDPDRALCGHDVSNHPEVSGTTPNDCVVCLDLEDQPCPHCGYNPTEENDR